mgnify:CR=1 FL=1
MVSPPHNLVIDEIPRLGQLPKEPVEYGGGLERGDVFHRHEIRTRLIDQASELQQQIPRLVRLRIGPSPLRRKRLTRGAPGQQTPPIPPLPQPNNVFASDLTDRLADETRLDVVLVRPLTGRIDVNPGDDVNARLLQPTRQTASPAEQIDGHHITNHDTKYILALSRRCGHWATLCCVSLSDVFFSWIAANPSAKTGDKRSLPINPPGPPTGAS